MLRWEAAKGMTEYMSVPPASAARTLSAGFDNMASNVLYLQFINYFGKHATRDQTYHNMAPAIGLTTDLDPRFEMAYTMGALALGTNGQHDEAYALWQKGVAAHPTNARFIYDAGMNLFLFAETQKEYERAAGFFRQAAALPGAPREARYMEARCYDVSNRRDLAIRVWLDTYRTSPSKEARAVAARSLQRLGVRPGSN